MVGVIPGKIESMNFSHYLCMNHLLLIENGEITRKACLNYLRMFNYKIYFKYFDIVIVNEKRIAEFGGGITSSTETKKFSILKIYFWNEYYTYGKEMAIELRDKHH
jgi:hypothetical protein